MPEVAHAYPVSAESSLRAKRGNLVEATDVEAGTRSPRRYAPRDDKLGTHEPKLCLTHAHGDPHCPVAEMPFRKSAPL